MHFGILLTFLHLVRQSLVLLLILALQLEHLLLQLAVHGQNNFWLRLLRGFKLIEAGHEMNVRICFRQVDHVQICLQSLCLLSCHHSSHLHKHDVFLLLYFTALFLVVAQNHVVGAILESSVFHLVVELVGVPKLRLHTQLLDHSVFLLEVGRPLLVILVLLENQAHVLAGFNLTAFFVLATGDQVANEGSLVLHL